MGLPSYKGTETSVFTAGWFKELGTTLKHVFEPFTGGWFTSPIDDVHDQHTQEIDYVPGEHTVKTTYSFNYKAFNPLANPLLKKCSSRFDGERELMQTLSQEAITKFGVPIEYYRIGYDEDPTTVDKIFGEKLDRQVLSVWTNVMFWHKIQRESRVWSKFGIDTSDSFSSWTPKAHFNFVTGGYYPQAGDIMREMSTGRFFEILEREEGDSEAVWLQSKQYLWEVKVKSLSLDGTLGISEEFKNTELYKLINRNDVLNIGGDVEVKKDAVLYESKPEESPSQSPFTGW